ncbi:putative 3-beta-hydroxysteroid-Delta(8),Delta(7)-isomerase [Acorus gramineus]|uniref:3-beta-hydroxysteroid-Delta(8),Delta(7)-isomerase n=1 Tax=Acorus gramineus TaxID=55184 RepID=A0AAV9B710_ACOGR|nr:putative 3-beta-hydroxysteroid-Delta(8),Delta(7)-isomerase [Acorus gramineus]
MSSAMEMEYPHPYVPTDLRLPGYVPNFLTQTEILVPYIASSFVVASLVWFFSVSSSPPEITIIGPRRPILLGRISKISKTDRILMCWWVFTGLTHIILEGYFVFSPEFYKKKVPCYLAEVWKEYSKGDSRYAGRDTAIVTVEGVTSVLEGPASLVAMYAIAAGKPYSHTLQLTICIGQLYGCIIYFVASFLDGDNFAKNPFYYWVYYVFANSIWVVIPTMIVIRSWRKISKAFLGENTKRKAH